MDKAQAAYQKKDYARSAELYLAAIEAGVQGADAPYNAACSFALAGKKREAFECLGMAVRRGMSNADHLVKDEDLTSLHGDPQWQPLMEACRASRKVEQQLWDSKAFETPYRDNLSDDEKVAGLSKLWFEIKINFVNFGLVPEVKWDALYLEYLPRVRQTKSTREYYKLLMQLGAQLKDANTNVYPPDELTDVFYARPRLTPRLVEDKVLIVGVSGDKLLQDGIKPGVEVLEINGMPVKNYARQEVIPYLSSSTKQDLEVRAYGYMLFAGPAEEPLRLTLADAEGNKFERSVPRIGFNTKPKTDSKPKAESSPKPQTVPPLKWKLYPDGIAYVPVDTFGNDRIVEQFKTAFSKVDKAAVLILDLRDNGGGNSGVGFRLLGMLTDKPFRISHWRTRDYRPVYRAAGVREEEWYEQTDGTWQPDGTRCYHKPVIVLTSPRTFSAAEDFCVAFDFLKRGTIIGEPTGGSTGQPLTFKLPGGGTARVCTKHDTYPDGKEFIGVGVQPHLLVVPTVADFRANRDTVLEAALTEARKLAGAK